MRDSIGTIREFETEQFKVVIEALIEDDLDLSWDDSGETVNKLESGDLIAFCAHSYVLHKPTGAILGEDYLGNCIYKSLRDFAFSDMIAQCIAEARKQLSAMRDVYVRA